MLSRRFVILCALIHAFTLQHIHHFGNIPCGLIWQQRYEFSVFPPQKTRAYTILRRGSKDSLHLWLRNKKKYGKVLHVKNEGSSETSSSKTKSKEKRRHKAKPWVAEAEAKWPNLKGCLKKNCGFFSWGDESQTKNHPLGNSKGIF